MCGLVALLDNHHAIDPGLAECIYASMRHRGPDDEHCYHQPSLLMCHTRLAVESRSQDRQPLISHCERYVAVVNGELYGYQSIRKEMERRGYIFQTQSDSELALVLYQYHGEDFVQHLRGEFALVLWDSEKRKLLAVRDRFGIKPLLYGVQRGRWYFGSEAKGLIAAGFRPAWSTRGLSQCLSHQYLLPSDSLFAGLAQIPAGHLLVLEDGKSTLKRYWQMQFRQCEYSSDVISSEDILSHLEEAIRLRIPTRVPCAFSLSGGLDSSAVLAIAQKMLDYVPDAYCVSFDQAQYDEYALAEEFALQQGVRIHRVKVTRDDLVEHMDVAAYFSEGLASNGQYVSKYLLSKAIAADGYRVVLSGEGADEAFMGYAHLQWDYVQSELRGQQRQHAQHYLSQKHALQKGLMLGETLKQSSAVPSFLMAKFAFCSEFSSLLRDEFASTLHQSLAQQELLATRCRTLSPVQAANKMWTQVVLANYILKTLGDGMEMASSVEGRLPFLDHHLFNLACATPTSNKLSHRQSKTILRQSLANVLPENITTREKHPFIAPPLYDGLSTRVVDTIFDRFSSQAFANNPVFNPERVKKWLVNWRRAASSQQKRMDPVLMTLLSFSALQTQFSLNEIG